MPVIINEVDQFDATIQAPDDGDAGNGATFQLAPQGLANRTRYLKKGIPGIADELLQTVSIGAGFAQSGVWEQIISGPAPGWLQASVAIDRSVDVILPVNLGVGRIGSVFCYVIGASGHSSLPAGMPHVLVVEKNLLTGTSSVIVNVFDSSANVPAFEARHVISATGINHSISSDPDVQYQVSLFGETDSNAEVGFQILGLKVGFVP